MKNDLLLIGVAAAGLYLISKSKASKLPSATPPAQSSPLATQPATVAVPTTPAPAINNVAPTVASVTSYGYTPVSGSPAYNAISSALSSGNAVYTIPGTAVTMTAPAGMSVLYSPSQGYYYG